MSALLECKDGVIHGPQECINISDGANTGPRTSNPVKTLEAHPENAVQGFRLPMCTEDNGWVSTPSCMRNITNGCRFLRYGVSSGAGLRKCTVRERACQ